MSRPTTSLILAPVEYKQLEQRAVAQRHGALAQPGRVQERLHLLDAQGLPGSR